MTITEITNQTLHKLTMIARRPHIRTLRVPGGWLYIIKDEGYVNTIFIPFPQLAPGGNTQERP